MSDVVQNIRLRIGADENVAPAMNAARAKMRSMFDSIRAMVNQNVAGSVSNAVGQQVQQATKGIAQSLKTAGGGAAGMARLSAGIAAVGTAASVAAVGVGIAAAAVAALGAAAAVTVAAVIKLYGTVGEQVDAAAKLADRLGLTTEGLASLSYNAQLSGVSSSALTGALEKMLATVGKATSGSSEAADSLQRLGLNAQNLARMSADQSFTAIAESIAKIPTAAGRAEATMSIFGKAGQDLLPILVQGQAGLRAMNEEARRSGALFSRFDAAKIEAVNDAFTRVGVRVNGYLRELAVGIAPLVQSIADKVLDILPSVDTVRFGIEFALAGINQALQFVAGGVTAYIALTKTMGVAWAVASNLVLGGIDLIGFGLAKLANLIPGMNVKWTRLSLDMTDAAASAASAWADVFNGTGPAAVDGFFQKARQTSNNAATEIARKAALEAEMQRRANMAGESERFDSMVDKLKTEAMNVGMSETAKQLREIEAAAGSAAQKGLARFYIELKQSREQAMQLKTFMDGLKTSIANIGVGSIEKAGIDAIAAGGNVVDKAIAEILAKAQQDIGKAFDAIGTTDDPWKAWERGLDVLDKLKREGTITAAVFDDLRRRMGQALDEALDKKYDGIADRIRDSLRTPIDDAMKDMDDALAAVKAGALSEADFEAYAKKVAGSFQVNAPERTNVTLASGADQGLKTGIAESARERLALLTPLVSISQDSKKIEAHMRKLLETMGEVAKRKPTVTWA